MKNIMKIIILHKVARKKKKNIPPSIIPISFQNSNILILDII